MIDTTQILSNIQNAELSTKGGSLIKLYIQSLIHKPYLILGVTFGVILFGLFMVKVFLDKEENVLQNKVLATMVYSGVFIFTLIALIAIDAGEFLLMNKIMG